MNHEPMVRAARRWLLDSPIRQCDSAQRDAGGVRRSLRVHGARRYYAEFYPEITAYAAQFLLRSETRTESAARDLAAAVASGHWLLHVQSGPSSPFPGAFPFAIDGKRATGGYFTFDTSIAVHALLDLDARQSSGPFARAAELGARWVLRQQREDGTFVAAAGAAQPVSWAGDAHCLHGKHAVMLGCMWRRTGHVVYRDAMQRVLRWIVGIQQPDGGIPASPTSGYVFLHTHCYAMEGLLTGAVELGDTRCMASAIRAADYLASRQRPHGGVVRFSGSGTPTYLRETGAHLPRLRAAFPPADVGVTAQAARLWTWTAHLAGRNYADAVNRALDWLARCQLHDGDPALDGAFPAGIDPLRPWRPAEMNLYPWVAIFAADAARLHAGTATTPDIY